MEIEEIGAILPLKTQNPKKRFENIVQVQTVDSGEN